MRTSTPLWNACLWGMGVGGALALAAGRPWLASAPVDLSASCAVARVVALSCWLRAEARREVFWESRSRRARFLHRLVNALAASALPSLFLALAVPAATGASVGRVGWGPEEAADIGIASTLAALLLEIRLPSRVLVITFVSLSWLLPTLLGHREPASAGSRALSAYGSLLASALAAALAIVVQRPRLGDA